MPTSNVQQPPRAWLSGEEYAYVYRRAPRLCIDLAIVTPDGILLSKRLIPPFKHTWHLPGGRVRHRESIDAAIKRIAEAELGIKVGKEKKELLGYADALKDGKFIHSVSMIFRIPSYSGKLRGSFQAKDFKNFKKIPKGIHPYHRRFLSENLPLLLKNLNEK